MSTLQLKAALAGALLGLWPLFMNRSGLSGTFGAAIVTALSLAVMLPAVWFDLEPGLTTLAAARWGSVALAALASGVGLLVFNSLIASASPAAIGGLFLLMLVVQASVPAIYTMVVGGPTLRKTAGLLAAGLAILLLS